MWLPDGFDPVMLDHDTFPSHLPCYLNEKKKQNQKDVPKSETDPQSVMSSFQAADYNNQVLYQTS